MKPKVELNSNGLNYLRKGESAVISDETNLRTKMLLMRFKYLMS